MRKKLIQYIKNLKLHQTKERAIVVIALLFCTFFILFYSYFLLIPWKLPGHYSSQQLTVKKGMTPQLIADSLSIRGIIRSSKHFLMAAKLLGVSRKLQAGEYHFKGRLNNYQVLRKLYRGKIATQKVTFPEGIRVEKIASILLESLGTDSVKFMNYTIDSLFIQKVGLDVNSLEGYLYPDTYRFSMNATPEKIIESMVWQFKENFTDMMRIQAKEMGLSIHEIVTLASIVEGEAVLESERKAIAALYHNRLKRRMRLQADPTIQYIIPDGPRRLLHRDLQIKSPYNTYLHAGLPPGPVNNPGLSSLMAVLYPDTVNYLYMVANGDGSHTFSSTLNDHLDAKRQFDKVRRKVRLKSR